MENVGVENIRVMTSVIWMMFITGILVVAAPIVVVGYLKKYMSVAMAPILLGFACYLAFSVVLVNVFGGFLMDAGRYVYTAVMIGIVSLFTFLAIFLGLRSLKKTAVNSSSAFLFAAGYAGFEAWVLGINHFTKAVTALNINYTGVAGLLANEPEEVQQVILDTAIGIAQISFFDNFAFLVSGLCIILSVISSALLIWMYIQGRTKIISLYVAIGGILVMRALQTLNQNGLLNAFLMVLAMAGSTFIIANMAHTAYRRYLNDIKFGKKGKRASRPDMRDVL